MIRVDAVYGDTLKIASGLGQSKARDKDEDAEQEDANDEVSGHFSTYNAE